MAYCGILDDLRKCIARVVPSRVPYFALGEDFDIRNAGFTHRQYRTDPAVMLAVARSAIAQFDYDWFLLHPDDLMEYERTTGIAVTDEETAPPAVRQYVPLTGCPERKWPLPDPLRDGRLPFHLQALRSIKKEFGERICLAGRIAAPFSSVALVFGIEPTLVLMLEDPERLRELMEYFARYNDVWAQAQVEAGADAIWLGDCVASSHFISAHQYAAFAAELADESSRRIQHRGGIVIYHGGERSIGHLEIMTSLSFDIINIGEGVSIGAVKKAIGGRKCFSGNLDPIKFLQQGSQAEVVQEVENIVQSGKPGGGYVFCTGEGIPHNTPAEHVRSMTEAVRTYGRY